MRTLAIPAAAVAAAALTGCTTYVNPPCTPTRLRAKDAEKLAKGSLARSAELSATVTAGGKPLPGVTVDFHVANDEGATFYSNDAATDAKGTAVLDLKRPDPRAVVALLRAERYSASFGGDDTYCASSDEAELRGFRRSRSEKG